MRALVTGGVGFIGSHIVDALLEDGNAVVIYDNFSTGFPLFIEHHRRHPRLKVVKGDILDVKRLASAMRGCGAVYHFAANADIRGGVLNTSIDLEQNTEGTRCVLEAARLNRVDQFVFASSAAVYGEPRKFPTPENYPLIQTSLYGASKAAAEGLIQSYSEYFGMKCWMFRFVSWVGERYTHGVVFDFVNKLRENPRSLEILGNGRQMKSYLYVRDGVSGIFAAMRAFPNGSKEAFNLGHVDLVPVTQVAKWVCQEMNLSDVRRQFTGGIRGWVGDSPIVHLDCRRIRQKGWKPQISIEEGIRRTARYLLANPKLLARRQSKARHKTR